jgi:diguanylate cyclase (GGDEF)-like protein
VLFHRARLTSMPLSLVEVDIDDFKLINDRDGHAAGDAAHRRGR